MHALDYVVLSTTLCAWILIGVITAWKKNKSQVTSARQYLYGDTKFSSLSIGLSLFASTVSASVVLSVITEMYLYGAEYLMSCAQIFVGIPITWYITTPVFCSSIKMESPYEYYEHRFGRSIKITAFLIQLIFSLLSMPIVLYGTVLSLSELTNIPLEICTSVVGSICILYTIIGGFSSVIWTDVGQSILMVISFSLLLVMGVLNVGSIAEVYRRAEEGGRLNILNFNPNPLERLSLWSCMIGMGFTQAANRSCSISALQRILACPNLNHARISVTIAGIGILITDFILCLIGLIIFANYYDCDPVKNQEINDPNNILPHFAISIFEHVPGLIGIFVTGLLCAGLSTISSELNGIAAILYYDVIKKLFKSTIVETYNKTIMMSIIFITGCTALIVAPHVQASASLIQLILALGGTCYGALFGLLLLGIMFPWANSKGALVGVITSLCLTSWISFGSLFYKMNDYKLLPTSIEGCPNTTRINYLNITENILKPDQAYQYSATTTEQPPLNFLNITDLISSESKGSFTLYSLSIAYYNILNCIIVISVGILVSYITGFNDISKVDERLIFSGWRGLLRTKNENQDAQQALNVIN